MARPAPARRRWMVTLRDDFAFALRRLRKERRFSLIAVLSLSTAIGVGTTIYSLVNTALLRPLPYADPDRLVMLGETNGAARGAASVPMFLAWRERIRGVTSVAALQPIRGAVRQGEAVEEVVGGAITEDYLRTLGIEPAAGRDFSAADHQGINGQVVLLTFGMWQRRFGGEADIVGRTISINDQDHVVVGVLGREFWSYAADVEYLIPRSFTAADLQAPGLSFRVVGRLSAGATSEAVRSEVERVASELRKEIPDWRLSPTWQVEVVSLHEWVSGGSRSLLVLLAGAVVLIFAVCCVNLANVATVRAIARQPEYALRSSLGGSTARLLQQTILESSIIALAGLAGGLSLAMLITARLGAIAPPGIARIQFVRIDSAAVLAACALALVSALAVGLVPVMRLSRGGLEQGLRSSSRRMIVSRREVAVGRALVFAQTGFIIILWVAASLGASSLRRLARIDPGFEGRDVVAFTINLPAARYPDNAAVEEFFRRLLPAIPSVPGALAGATATDLPLRRSMFGYVVREGDGPEVERTLINMSVISPQYLEILDIPLVSGRGFTDGEYRSPPSTIIINEATARQLFPGQDPVGRGLGFDVNGPFLRIVGVVPDVLEEALGQPQGVHMYVPNALFGLPFRVGVRELVVQAAGEDPMSVVPGIRRLVQRLDPSQAIAEIRPLSALRDGELHAPRFHLLALGLFAAAALFMGVIGIYAVVRQAVAMREPEFALRMAIGGPSWRVFGEAFAREAAPLTLGIAGGVLGAMASIRFVRSVFAGLDQLTVAACAPAVLVVCVIGFASILVPLYRVISVQPAVALRR